MKKTITIVIIILSIPILPKAQNNNVLRLFENGVDAYLLADSVNIRMEPNTNSQIITKLLIGTKVKILEESKDVSTINNITMPWYFVSFNNTQKGYIWGGKIAQASCRSMKDWNVEFHFGLEKVDSVNIYYQIRVVKNNKEITKASFKGFSGLEKRYEFTNVSNKGLSNLDDILHIDGFGEACGDDGGTIVFFWSNTKLHYIDQLTNRVDVPSFVKESFIYPCDIDGKKDYIIKKFVSGEFIFEDEAGKTLPKNKIRYDENKLLFYIWTGNKLEIVK